VRSLLKLLPSFVLLIASATATWSAADDVVVNVEAMIGEATLVRESADGKKETLIVPTGKTTKNDPTTGQTLLTPATQPDKVNEVVQAIAASAPDAGNQRPSDNGCSQGNAPHRLVPRPAYDAAITAVIATELEGMSSGELMMVMAVLINNANHLCIDASTVANTVNLIVTERPEEAGNVVYVASLLDPDNSDPYADEALKAAPSEAKKIEEAKESADNRPKTYPKPPPAQPAPPIEPERDIPPGGSIGEPPSPE
jgi:hypothetical protein